MTSNSPTCSDLVPDSLGWCCSSRMHSQKVIEVKFQLVSFFLISWAVPSLHSKYDHGEQPRQVPVRVNRLSEDG